MAMTKEDLSRPVKIHICKDKTLSFRYAFEPIFNGVALPVFSVQSKTEAEALVLLVGRRQYGEHPKMPGAPWFKMTLPGPLDFEPVLDLEDLDAVSDHLRERYDLLKTNVETGA